ncbi:MULTISPECIES: DsbA family oxidoreductase [Thermomonas]|jgi:predicted DsbA family dithiol-disulfide isomerase|uniref:DsbA family oxidoreductase n=1 Tax=Thermomonas TaxID=141948 RepID=UPI000422A93D|nr:MULTISPECIES: DsbA family oxidoreductase [Thermomonas]MBH2009844.1 DsbA family oxidoreductase [Xanthomonadaceae bacterium]
MTKLRIDFVSDVVCPWCAVGLASLEQALRQLQGEVEAEIHFQPFELDPNMPADGMDVADNLKRKYGMSDAQLAENQARIRDRGAELGFSFDFNARSRTWNTFDAHRLLHWAAAEAQERQLPLKRALLVANFSEGRDISDHAVLADVAAGVGLDAERAGAVLAGGEFADAVRDAEKFFQGLGISSVPAVIVERKHLISGGQPPEVFERALREIAAAAD